MSVEETSSAAWLVQETIKDIKQQFRLMMDGSVASSMRSKGVAWPLNWGATLPRLEALAKSYTPDHHLAIALWKERVRECKLLAVMLMPPEAMPRELAELWIEETDHQEIAEQASMRLFQHLPYAADLAYACIASSAPYPQLCGYHILTRLLRRGASLNARAGEELLDQARAALQDPSLAVRKAALRAVQSYAALGILQDRTSRAMLRSLGLDVF